MGMASMASFLADFEFGKQAGRYAVAELPKLPFADDSFELALCSHLQSIAEMLRLAPEVHIFPWLELGSMPSRHLDAVIEEMRLQSHQLQVKITPL